MSRTDVKANVKPFTISRNFPVKIERVWKAFTDPDQMVWWGPKGFTSKTIKMDFRPGGSYHYSLKADAGGHEMWGIWAIREIQKPNRLVYVNSFSDAKAALTRHPANANWPLEMLTTLTFEADGPDATKMTIEWIPLNANDVEVKTFDENRASMTAGWTGVLDKVSAFLSDKHPDHYVPYLIFGGNCAEAMTFYAKNLGAHLHTMTYAEAGMGDDPKTKDRVIHARIKRGGAWLMASDDQPGSTVTQGSNISISVGCDSREELDRLFGAFSEGAKAVTMPAGETFFAERFGMLTDKFGIGWMFIFEGSKK